MQIPHRMRLRCRVCGFSELRIDEVVERGLVRLAECPRCEDRSTAALEGGARVRAVAKVVREVAPAA